MGKSIATTACVLTTDVMQATATIITPPSTKVMANGNPCYRGTLTIQVVGAIQGAIVQNAPMTTTLVGTSTKVMIEGQPAVLEGDKSLPAMCPATDNTIASNPVPTTLPVTVTIASAGQVKVSAS